MYFKSYVIGGDNHPKAVHRTKSNIEASSSKCKIDLLHWNVSQLPFKDSVIDIAVTDMVIKYLNNFYCILNFSFNLLNNSYSHLEKEVVE